MIWKTWITMNYPKLETICLKIDKDLGYDLLSHFCEWLNDNEEKFMIIADDDKIKYVYRWMLNQKKWYNSSFSKKYKMLSSRDEITIQDKGYNQNSDIIDYDDYNDWIKDIVNNYDEEDAKKIIKMREIYLKLSTIDKVAYDLYFTNMMSMRDIAAKLDIPLSAVYGIIKNLKIKIKNEFN
jgi:hypothetical protein